MHAPFMTLFVFLMVIIETFLPQALETFFLRSTTGPPAYRAGPSLVELGYPRCSRFPPRLQGAHPRWEGYRCAELSSAGGALLPYFAQLSAHEREDMLLTSVVCSTSDIFKFWELNPGLPYAR